MEYLNEIPSDFKERLLAKLATLLAILSGLRARYILSVIDLRNS